MHFKTIFFVFLLLTCHFLLLTIGSAELLDRVVAIVDDEAIMLSEFKEVYQNTLSSGRKITKEEVLNGLINRVLLLKQAKRYVPLMERIGDKDALINIYINRRIKAFIRIPFEEIESFYRENQESFVGKGLYEVRNEIERFLLEKKTNEMLKKHLQELREKAYIRIQLRPDD
jgi:hypothetical protein